MERHPIPVIHAGFNWLSCGAGCALVLLAFTLLVTISAPLILNWTQLVLDTVTMWLMKGYIALPRVG